MRTSAVIVCYNPDPALLGTTCERLLEEGAEVVLVDNSETPVVWESPIFARCTIIENEGNLGIARAQNIGIRRCVQSGAEAIVFFDQDSEIGPGFLQALFSPLEPGIPGIAAPVSRDAVHGFEYAPTRVSRLGFQRKIFAEGRTDPYRVDIVLASGVAATVETFSVAGEMDESLFIDLVDLEWCLRCRRHGIPLHVVPKAVMNHSIGNRSFEAGGATVLVHSPTRCYYQIRNSLLLLRRWEVPKLLATREALVLLMHKTLLLLRVADRQAYLSAYAQGFLDGLRGVAGKNPRQA